MDFNQVVQLQLKTPHDLRHLLEEHGQAHHVLHDTVSDWWWFCEDRNRLLEFVFNSGNPIRFKSRPAAAHPGEARWELEGDHNDPVRTYDVNQFFLSPAMPPDLLRDQFWNDFLSQDLGAYAYWDRDNPFNDLEEYLFYWEMAADGTHLEPVTPPAAAVTGPPAGPA
jgi:hypothetical protein